MENVFSHMSYIGHYLVIAAQYRIHPSSIYLFCLFQLCIHTNIIPFHIRRAITFGIKSRFEPPYSIKLQNAILQLTENIQREFRHQSRIGWGHFNRGRLSITSGSLVNQAITRQ